MHTHTVIQLFQEKHSLLCVIGRFEDAQTLISRFIGLKIVFKPLKQKPQSHGGKLINNNTTNRTKLGKYFHNVYGFTRLLHRGDIYFISLRSLQEFHGGETVSVNINKTINIFEQINHDKK